MLEITPTIERDPDPGWDAFVEAAPGGSHLQSTGWAQVKRAAGWEPGYILAREGGALVGGCQLLTRRISFLGPVAYVPRGLLTASGHSEVDEPLTEGLLTAFRRYRYLFVKLQPAEHGEATAARLRGRGWVASSVPVAPDATTRVIAEGSDEELLATMRSSTRRQIRAARASGVTVRVGGLDDVETFGRLVDATGRRQGFGGYPAAYYRTILTAFGDRARLLLGELDGEAYAGTLLVLFADTVSYVFGGWAGERPEVHAPKLVHWEGIRLARDLGYRYYDLNGIEPRVAAGLLAGGKVADTPGLEQFKLGFGGEVVLLPPTLDRSFHPLGSGIQRMAPLVSRQKRLATVMLGMRRKPPSESRS